MNLQADFQANPAGLSRLKHDSSDKSSRIAVLAAHPDDETIGASSLLAGFPNISVIFVTDGAPRDVRFWPAAMQATREQYAELRRIEAEKALTHAGVSSRQITWLGGVDQEAILGVRALASRLFEVLDVLPPEIVVTHPYEGGHPDHDAAALLARMVNVRLGTDTSVVEMTSYHALEGELVTGEFLDGDRMREITRELSPEEKERKWRMFAEYRSQKKVLQSFSVDHERLRMAPAYDFSKPPHKGKLWYECLGWEMAGARWRSLAAAALVETVSCH